MSEAVEKLAREILTMCMLSKRDFNTAAREKDAKSGAAMPDGSFPILNAEDLMNAIHAIGRAKDPAAVKAHIRKRASALGLEHVLKMHGPSFFDGAGEGGSGMG
jgi:hypothetical protein